jgi:hypothetical protein
MKIPIGILLLALTGPSHFAAGVSYRFEAGEPLAYKLQLTATNETVVDSRYFATTGQTEKKGSASFSLNYQFMPILQDEKGVWKIRLVLDQAGHVIREGGETKEKTYHRDAFPTYQVSASEIMKINLAQYSIGKQVFNDDTNATSQLKPHGAEDLFDQPILAWLSPNGILENFEDRTEMHQLMPGVDLKECLKVILPSLPPDDLKAGSTWSRDVPLGFPETPLHPVEPMKLTLRFAVETVEKIEGRDCARMTVHGKFARAGLSVPIRHEIIKYLRWTFSIGRIEDSVDGEFVFDLERGTLRSSAIETAYSYSTFAVRKEDRGRGRIESQSIIRSRLVNTLVPPAPPPVATSSVSKTDLAK